jgi:hypothetical protein
MTPLLWIALGFVALLVAFLMITYLRRDTSTANQHNTLRFLTALCSGFAGGFFTGDALFRLAGCGKTQVESENSLVSTVRTDKKKACAEKTSSSWTCSVTSVPSSEFRRTIRYVRCGP